MYIAGQSDLCAIDADGSLKWKYLTSGSMDHNPFAVDRNGVLLTVNETCAGKLYAINSDGTLKWLFERGDINDIPCLQRSYFIGENDTVYVVTDRGIMAFADAATVPAYDLTGTWAYQDTDAWDNCPEPAPEGSGSIEVTHNNDKLNLTTEDGSLTGFIYGAVLNVSGNYEADGGTVTQHIHVTLATETEGSGISTWTWSDGSSSCEGESSFNFNKVNNEGSQPEENADNPGGDGNVSCFISTLNS